MPAYRPRCRNPPGSDQACSRCRRFGKCGRGLAPASDRTASGEPADHGLAVFDRVTMDLPGTRTRRHIGSGRSRAGRSSRRPAPCWWSRAIRRARWARRAALRPAFRSPMSRLGCAPTFPKCRGPRSVFGRSTAGRPAVRADRTSAENLRAEGCPGPSHYRQHRHRRADRRLGGGLPPAPARRGAPLRLLVTCHRREFWGRLCLGRRRARSTARVDEVRHHPDRAPSQSARQRGDARLARASPWVEMLAPLTTLR